MVLIENSLCGLAALSCASLGAIFDLRSRRIPNLLTGPSVLAGLALHFYIGGVRDLGTSLLACLFSSAVFLIFYIAGGMGAGDVKLIGAVACLLGFSGVGALLVYTAIAGGVLAIGLALVRGKLRETLTNVGSLVLHHGAEGLRPHPELNVASPRTLKLPYGVAIATGCAVHCLMLVY